MFKKTFFLFLFLIVGYFSQAQLTITSNYFDNGVYNLETEEWEFTEIAESKDIFIFDEEFLFFQQKNNIISLEYDITEYTYDEKEFVHKMKIYDFLADEKLDLEIDETNGLIILSWIDQDLKFVVERYYIDEIFKD